MDSISFHHSGFAEIKLPVAAYHVILMIAGRPCQKGLTDQFRQAFYMYGNFSFESFLRGDIASLAWDAESG